MTLEPHAVLLDPVSGTTQPQARASARTLEGMRGLFASEHTADRDNVVVYTTSTAPFVEGPGELSFGETRIEAGDLNGELFMTHGHIHIRPDGEVYIGQSGMGGVVLQKDDEVKWIPMTQNTVCYIPPLWKHRSVNTGSEPFVFLSVYPSQSGQDYEPVRRNGMGARVYRAGAGYSVIADNGAIIADAAS